MRARRIERRVAADSGGLPEELHPLLRRLYAARGVMSKADLDLVLASLADYRTLGGMDRAVMLLCDCLTVQRRILVVGDFDADGATSSALLVRVLRRFGAEQADYLVPNRFEYGYGLTPEIVALAAGRKPDLIITVDNGISSHAGVSAARERGIRVLVTDHHLPGATLPEADAILNPNLRGDGFPSKHLAGVGVVFYLLMALRARLREAGWFAARGLAEPNLAEYLDIVALGTVADMVQLDHNNRVLVAEGLRRIRAGRCIPAIAALMETGNRDLRRLSASDLGFTVAPRLNAAGRLTDMSLGIECLLTDDPARARQLARRLDELNRERRDIEAKMREEAFAVLAHLDFSADDPALPVGLSLFNPDWHQGVVGLVASKVKDKVQRPVIAFARAEDGGLKGSARSVPGMHIRDALEAVSTRHPGLITKFGGHAMAAGLSLEEARFQEFRAAFDAEARRWLSGDDLAGVLHTDGELEAEYFTLECAELLREAGPWGQGFPPPLFDGEFRLLERRLLSGGHLKLMLEHGTGGRRCEAIAFGQTGDHIPPACHRVRIAYKPDVNEYRGERRLQLLIEHIEPA
ncbi:MAG TPA: single-stranded-DNA-specific exonuclease RecJ [Gammaproteobacteria bacterium]|nr:single-stranded-DNA-specific exonuclease RecJ [Gammaproteobacteria bacterium]